MLRKSLLDKFYQSLQQLRQCVFVDSVLIVSYMQGNLLKHFICAKFSL